VRDGDNGGYSGENGASVIPAGGTPGQGGNGGNPNPATPPERDGGPGTVTISYYY
jgi:hypothetical protein